MESNPAKESLKQNNEEAAARMYAVSDYKQWSQLSSGLAETHEQLSDAYAAGTSDGVFQRTDGEMRITQEESPR